MTFPSDRSYLLLPTTAPAVPTEPALLGVVENAALGIKTTRVTDVDGRRQAYPQSAVWNCDGTLALLAFSYPGRMLDGVTYEDLGSFAHVSEFTWSATDPLKGYGVNGAGANILYRQIVNPDGSLASTTAIHTFGAYTSIRIGGDYSGSAPQGWAVSDDDRYICLTGYSGGARKVFVFDLVADAIVGTPLTAPAGLDSAQISPSGAYVVLTHGAGTTRYARDMTSPLLLWASHNHGDGGRNAAGEDIFVANNEGGNGVRSARLSDGAITQLLPAGLAAEYGHVCGHALRDRPGHVILSSHNYTATVGRRGVDAVYDLRTDGSMVVEIYGFAFHRIGESPYELQPHAVGSPDGSRVMATLFSTGTGDAANAFVLEATGNAPLPGGGTGGGTGGEYVPPGGDLIPSGVVENVFLGATVTTAGDGPGGPSSSPYPINTPEKLVDGTSATTSIGDAVDNPPLPAQTYRSFWIMDLGAPAQLTSIALAYAGFGSGSISIEGSPDGASWTEVVSDADIAAGAGAITGGFISTVAVDATYRYWRMIWAVFYPGAGLQFRSGMVVIELSCEGEMFVPAPTPPPPPGEIIDVYDPGDVLLATLGDAFEVMARKELNSTGTGSFKIRRDSPDATAAVLAPGNYVRVTVPQIDPDPIFGFFLEAGDFKLVATAERGGEIVTFAGRGGLAYWDRAIWLAESFLVPWWPSYIEDEWGPPPATAMGTVGFAIGSYKRYTHSGGALTSSIPFTTAEGFSNYYDRVVRITYNADGDQMTLVRLTDGPYIGWWVKPYGAGVRRYLKRSVYALGPSVLMSEISANQTPGEVIFAMFQEANAADRPIHPVPLMAIDFDDTTDSNGDPWTVTDALEGVSAELGDDYLSTIGKLINTGALDVDMGPDLDMHVYNAYGRDLAGDVLFAKGTNIADELSRRFSDSPVGTFAEVLGSEDGAIARVELPDSAGRAPREISVRGDTADANALEALGLSTLQARLLHSDAVGFNVDTPRVGAEDPEVGLYLPGPPGSARGNYWVGDLVTLHTGDAEFDFDGVTVRIYAITLRWDEAKNLRVTAEVLSGFGGFQEIGGSSGSSTSTTGAGGSGSSTLSDLYQLISERDKPHGYPTLGDEGEVDPLEIPVLEALRTDETDTTLVASPDGAGGVTFRAETGGLTRWEPHVDYTGSVVLDGNGDPVMVEVAI